MYIQHVHVNNTCTVSRNVGVGVNYCLAFYDLLAKLASIYEDMMVMGWESLLKIQIKS